MTINWNGAELNLGSLAVLAAITFLINAASTILDRLFWTNGLKERIGLIKEMSELAANGMLPEKVSSQYIEDATQWIESHVTKRNFLSMLVGTFVRGSLFLYFAMAAGVFQLLDKLNKGASCSELANWAVAYLIGTFAIEGFLATFRPLVKPLSKRN